MLVIDSAAKMTEYSKARRAEGKTIGFVPTMGYFHDGHLSLMRTARERADVVVISIFVNPTQFAPNEDLSRYPRDFEGDSNKAESVGVDVLFYPGVSDIYPDGYQTTVSVGDLAKPLCGVTRPTHFQGVATVCTKLFNIVQPHFAVFGEKDYQQLLVIKRIVKDLNLDLEIIPGPTGRESDGLAMSSRNAYLTPEHRAQAPALQRALGRAREMVAGGENDPAKIIAAVRAIIAEAPLGKIDYVDLRKLPDLTETAARPKGEHLLAVAVYFDKTRLIDNTVLPFPE